MKLESATGSYVQRLAAVFFSGIADSADEFQKAFQEAHRLSAFLVWVEEETSRFCEHRVEKAVFQAPSTPLEAVAASIAAVRARTCLLRDNKGLDLAFLVDAKFRRNVERTINEHRDKAVEAVKLRAQEDRWEPVNCFNKAGAERFLDEMSAAGIPSARNYLYDECWIALTQNTTSFSLSYLSFADSLLRMFNPSLR